MPKPLRVAGEVDSWCTRCRLTLNHRIVSMKNGKPHKVECLTCRSQHMWRPKEPGDRVVPAPATKGAKSGGASGTHTKTPPGKTSRVTQAMRHEQQWEKAIAGRALADFKAYSVGANFQEGDLLRHRKFGDGVVTRVIDSHKVEVLFRDEAKTLAQGMT